MKADYEIFNLTSVADTNNVISVLYSKAYENIADKETVEFINEIAKKPKTGENIYFKIYSEMKKVYTSSQLKQFADSSLKSEKHIKYLINKTINISSLNIGVLLVQSNSNSKWENITLPITFGMVYVMIVVSIIYLIWTLIKKKQINWIVAFCISLITANIFTLIVGAPFEAQRLFAASIVLVLIFVAYILENILKDKKSNEQI